MDDNFDGRITYSDVKLIDKNNRTIRWDPEISLAACKKTEVLNCEYTDKGICKYQLGAINDMKHPNIDCVISIIGTINPESHTIIVSHYIKSSNTTHREDTFYRRQSGRQMLPARK